MRTLKALVIAGIIYLTPFTTTPLQANPIGGLREKNLSVTGQLGAALLLTELRRNFKPLQDEFTHQPGPSFSLSASYALSENWEPGLSLGFYPLSGSTDRPYFSANGLQTAFRNINTDLPVRYDNQSTSVLAFIRYFPLKRPSSGIPELQVKPYAELGAGMNFFGTQVKYEEVPEGGNAVIWEKTDQNRGHVAHFSLGLGATTLFYKDWKLLVSVNGDLIDYDVVDGVHNYSGGERNHARTLIFRFMTGISVPVAHLSFPFTKFRAPGSPWEKP